MAGQTPPVPPRPTSSGLDADRLGALDSDAWAEVVRAARRVIPDHRGADPRLSEFAEAPVSRLAAGRGRRRLIQRLCQDPALGRAVLEALEEGIGAEAARALTAGGEPPGPDPAGSDEASPEAGRREARAKQRVRRLIADRDRWRRRAEGAEARVAGLADELAAERAAHAVTSGRLAEAEEAVTGAAAQRERVVARERRRGEVRLARLAEELTEARREEQAIRQVLRRVRERTAAGDAAAQTGPRTTEPGPADVDGLVPGRPSRVPAGLERGTTEHAAALLHPSRRVLVDGYNVTRLHRSRLDLAGQRDWLVQLLVRGVAARGIRPTVVFDGQQASANRPRPGAGDVEVWFTPAGITADDEIVLALEATDEPVVVVTDDRELVERSRAVGADVIGTTPFVGAVTSAS